jgi:zinc protease
MTVSAPDRKHAPSFGTLDKIDIAEADASALKNGIPVFKLDAGSQELVRIELIFPKAGAADQPLAAVAVGTNDMLDEGTNLHTSSELAESMDYYGAFLQMEATMDFSSVCLFSLNKHLPETLPLLEEIVKQANFPEHEVQTYIQNKKQKFLVDEAKVSTVARKKFTQMLFGDEHPYGHYMVEMEFDKLDRNLFAGFYASAYAPTQCHIVLAGKIDPRMDGLLEKHFGAGTWETGANQKSTKLIAVKASGQRKQYIEKKDAVQSALRIGRLMFNKTHPDYLGMQVLNTVFGGYFGSRLMSNIREDKGYTYGIGSGMVSLKQGGYFFISTEVGVDVCSKALKEIYFELNRLRTELIGEEELSLVRNYMLGTFLRSADGPFSLADKFKGIYDFGLDYHYYQRYIQTIKNISPEELRNLANKYFREEDMMELVVGKM